MDTVTVTQEKQVRDIDQFWKDARLRVSEAIEKIELLESFRPKNKLTIYKYPNSFPLSILKKICQSLEKEKGFDGLEKVVIDAGEEHKFILARNGSEIHSQYEKKQWETGGIQSLEIDDLGEFRVVEVEFGIITRGADFSLFCVKD